MKAKIIGYGVSGKAAESFLTKQQIETVVVADVGEKITPDYDFCVISPGVPITMVAEENVPIVPEIELPFYCDRHLQPRCLIAVTGTNGKTTVVKQIYDACCAAGKKSVLCGNVGVPISRVADRLTHAIVVAEVSSFMLEQTIRLHPQIAVITNITPDHLDRHQTMTEYLRCKARICANQTKRDVLIVNWDDPYARQVGQEIQRQHHRVLWFSLYEPVRGYYVADGWVYEKRGCRSRRLFDVSVCGGMPHAIANALAVVAVGRCLHLPLTAIINSCTYQTRPHRLELVADDHGVAFYNDSKATNIAATLAAVRSLQLPISLILCGLSKGQDYHELLAHLPNHVQQVFVFGAIRDTVMAVATELQMTNVHAVANLAAAVCQAWQSVPRPGVVLFSPSGSSFDQFTDYQERGKAFSTCVQKLLIEQHNVGA